jgi:phosphoribosylglycinamide formyltransferase-1
LKRLYRVGVLGSGKGSNFVALADAAAADPNTPYEIALVLSDVAEAGILIHARNRGIAGEYLPPGPFRTKLDEAAEARYVAALRKAEVDLVALAGFMRVLKDQFLSAFPAKVINIHPSLLPAFPGLESWKQALEHGVKFTGCTVHFVDPGVDTGPIIGQQVVPVLDDDSSAALHARIQVAEHELYPAVVRALADGRITVHGRLTTWRED